MDKASRAAGYRAVFNADPNVGGRYSALTAFGLVPAGLAGVDIEEFLEEAAAAAEFLAEDDEDNIALALGAAMAGTVPLRNKLIFADEGSGLVGFADWAEQLIAESTGKSETGVLPVVVEAGAPETTSTAADLLQIRLVADTGLLTDDDVDSDSASVCISGSLGAQMLLWEYATVMAGRLLGIDPFDQPDVEAAKVAARALLEATPEPVPAALARTRSRSAPPTGCSRASPTWRARCAPCWRRCRPTATSASRPTWTATATPQLEGIRPAWPRRPAAR